MADLQDYKCPACGGAIAFDSQVQMMKCPYCDTEYEMASLLKYDEILKGDKADQMNWEKTAESDWDQAELEDLTVYGCKSCGGEIIVDKTTSATACPFCDNPVVVMGRFSGDLRPDYIIPFKLDKEAAKAGFAKHLENKKLLPRVFKERKRLDEIKGVYVPFWLFDADADAEIRYKVSKNQHYSDSNYDYTKTSYYAVSRSGQTRFENVPVDGSSKMDDELMESIEPFDFSQAVDFQTAYLAGYLADRYDVQEHDSVDRANDRIKKTIEAEFEKTVTGYDSVVAEHSSIQLDNAKAKYALYPVWVMNTKWQGKLYTFAMNGQTGKFVGDLPMDKTSYWKYFAIYAAIGAVAMWALARFVLT